MTEEITTIGIIGFGRFGQLMVEYLSEDFRVKVSSHSKDANTVGKSGGELTSLKEVCQCDAVIPAVPISAFGETMQRIAPMIAGNLVIDVCSVKEYPVEQMRKYLTEETQILATHPMFGPDSAGDTVEGQKIVIHGVRVPDDLYACIKSYLKEKGLQVIEATPEEHDRQIARSQVLTHFIGRGLSIYGAKGIAIDTEGYKRLLHILDVVENDTPQLFTDMNKYNRFAEAARHEFIQALQEIEQELQ
ncbi:MAG: T-protein [Candidatus Marinimicrobia bacterium]|nr:T-protein [Candidatus Neomarinimicrobiota bacterium]